MATDIRPYFDKKEQFTKIEESSLPGERIFAVFDMKGGGTGFLGITDKRLIIYDKAFGRKMKAVVSVPLSKVSSVATEDESGLLTGRGFFGSSKLMIQVGSEDYEFEFRGADKAHMAHDLILRLIL